MEIEFCSVLIFLIIILILTGYLKRHSDDNSAESIVEKKEGYGEPPGMTPAKPVQDYYCYPHIVASPSKETLKYICGPSMVCKDRPECYYGWALAPFEFQSSTASAISRMIERVA